MASHHNVDPLLTAERISLQAALQFQISYTNPKHQEMRQNNDEYLENELKASLIEAARIALGSKREPDGSDINFLNQLAVSILLVDTRRYIGMPAFRRWAATDLESDASWNVLVWDRELGAERRVRTGNPRNFDLLSLPPALFIHNDYPSKRHPFGTLQAVIDAAAAKSGMPNVKAEAHLEAVRSTIVQTIEHPPQVSIAEAQIPDDYEAWYTSLPPTDNAYILFEPRLPETIKELREKQRLDGLRKEQILTLGGVQSELAAGQASRYPRQAVAGFRQAGKTFGEIAKHTATDKPVLYESFLARYATDIQGAIVKDGEHFDRRRSSESLALAAKSFLRHYAAMNKSEDPAAKEQLDIILQSMTLCLLAAADETESCLIYPAPKRQQDTRQGGWHLSALSFGPRRMFRMAYGTTIRLEEVDKKHQDKHLMTSNTFLTTLPALIRTAQASQRKSKQKLPDITPFEVLSLAKDKILWPEALRPEDKALLDGITAQLISGTRLAGLL